MNLKKTRLIRRISLLLIGSLILSLMSLAVFADDDPLDPGSAETGVEVENMAALRKAISDAGNTPTTILLNQDFELNSFVKIPSGAEITINGQEHTLTQTSKERHFKVSGTLTLESITLTCKESGGIGGIDVGEWNIAEGTLILEKDAVIRGNTSPSNTNNGGAINVFGGNLIMNDGKIENNFASGLGKGGGVMITKGTFTMNGGEIKDNSAGTYGGGVYTQGEFIMDDGKISGNISCYDPPHTTDGGGAGVYVHGNGGSGKFIMSDGEISNNVVKAKSKGNGGGVFLLYGANMIMDGGTISDNTAPQHGGGVYADGDRYWPTAFTINGGLIDKNTAVGNGGGVYTTSFGDFTMTGGTISENSAVLGGGVYLSKNFKMDNGKISKNKATENGGGIYALNEVSIQNNSIIASNHADKNGGGIFTKNRSVLSINDSTIGGDSQIDGNSAGVNGGGIYKSSGTINIQNSEVEGNQTENGNGGGIYVYACKLNIENSKVRSNTALNGHGGGISCQAKKYSGGPFDITLNNTDMSANMAYGNGGGISVQGQFKTTISGGTVTDNVAISNGFNSTGKGGGLYFTGDTNDFKE